MWDSVVAQVLLMLAGAIVGQALAMATPAILDVLKLRRAPSIVGRWISIYRPDFRTQQQWIREEMHIEYRRGRIVMNNTKHPTSDYYVVDAKIINKVYVVGSWSSKQPGANASGAVVMTISPLGDMMYGYYTGLGDTGERTYCAWVMVRSEAQVTRAIELARDLTLGFSPSPQEILGARGE